MIEDGWVITDDPLVIKFGGVDLDIDLGAEQLIGAEKEEQKIAVEIKSFLGPSPVTDFHAALGWFLNYRYALEIEGPERLLFLAIPADVHEDFFQLPFTRGAVARNRVPLRVFDPLEERVLQ